MKENPQTKRNPKSRAARPGLGEIRVSKGFTQESLAEASGLSTDVIQRIEAPNPVPVGIDKLQIYARWLGLSWEDVVPSEQSKSSTPKPTTELGPWVILPPGPWTTAANRLQWCAHELRHKHIPGRKARGKLYDLRQHLAWQTLHEIRHWLTRHAEISDRIGKLSSHVGRNIDCLPDEARAEHWWVIDNWIDGPSLEEMLSKGPLKSERAVALMLDVAEVLQVLHREGLVYRVLAPRSIYVTADGAVVSDFEMTKMAESGFTVAPRDRWPQRDVFIAPEVRDREPAKPVADLYSWAMVLACALYGTSIDGRTHARSIIHGARMPGDIANFALACLEPKSRRPSLDALLTSHRPKGVNVR